MNKDANSWNGKLLSYLHNNHPSRKDASDIVMDLSLAAYLPYAMQFEGVSETECRETALYSVEFLLSHVYAIKNAFGLSENEEMQGFIDEKGSSNHIAPSLKNINNHLAPAKQTNIEDDDDFYDDMLELPDIDAGFRV